MPNNKDCTPFPPIIDGIPGQRYKLPGPQVEPGAGYWTDGPCTIPCVIRVSELLPFTDNPKHRCYLKPYPSDPKVRDKEIKELKDLAGRRNDPLPAGEISRFLQMRPQPLGTVFCLDREQKPLETLDEQCTLTKRQDDPPVIMTGKELARWFEGETPGLGHRHALNCLILECNLSPPRQARIWMALDVAIYSALIACWHYKWASDRPCVSYRPRPFEVDKTVSVLYDRCVDNKGCEDDGKRFFPTPSPGTPRHPAYPSGHSTVGGAASEILSYFFPKHKAEIDKLGDNSGMARLWAGIHYRSDHEEGMALGRCVARMVISQLEGDGVPLPKEPPAPTPENAKKPAPTKEEVRQNSYNERAACLRDPSKIECFPPRDTCAEDKEGFAPTSVQKGAQ